MGFQKTGKAQRIGENLTFEQVQKNESPPADREREAQKPPQGEKAPRDFRN